MSQTIVMLGPQRHEPMLREAVDSLGLAGDLAVITAGWEERESEDDELREHLGGKTVNLEIYRRVEEVFQRDPELFAAMRDRHDRLRRLQSYYRLELSRALDSARDLLAREDPEHPDLLESARTSAIESVRVLDRHHLAKIRSIHAEFRERWKPAERDAVVRARREVERLIDGTEAVCVAGGHVAILLNRMRLLDLHQLFGARPLLCWSAGAMALSDRVVLFHDSPPQGPGDAEVLEVGLGVCPDVVPLPHARHRLRLNDRARVALFSRRFGPAQCVVLDEGTRLGWNGVRWVPEGPARELARSGDVTDVEAA